MRTTLFFTIVFFAGTTLPAQYQENTRGDIPLNSVSVNILGDASIISLNYERQHFIDSNTLLTSKIGLGYNEKFEFCLFGPCDTRPESYLIVPHHFTANFGKRKHFFEVGLGGSIVLGNTTQPYIFYPMVGYRFLPLRSEKVNFRVYAQMPVTGIDTEDILFLPFGLNLGMSF